MPTIATTVRIPEHLQQRFDKLARATGRTRNFLMADALERYIAREEWQVGETQATLARLEAGELELISADDLIAQHIAEGRLTESALAEAYKRYGVEP